MYLMKLIYLLEPADRRFLNLLIPAQPIPSEFDFIEHLTGIPNLTHAWNRFGLKSDVVERVRSASVVRR